MSIIIKPDDETCWSGQDSQIVESHSEASDNILELYPDGWFTPELDRITLPSALVAGEIDLSLNPIATIEAELCKGQITDALEGLRLAFGDKSLCFRTEVRNA